MILYNSENSIRDTKPFFSIVLSRQCSEDTSYLLQ